MTADRRSVLGGLIGAGLGLGALRPALANEPPVVVLAAGAVQKPIQELIELFEKHNGAKVNATYDTVGALKERVLAGETPDLLLLSAAAMKELAEKGKLSRGQHASIGRTGVGLCAPLAAPEIDISTAEKLKAALLAAPSIAHADPARGATAGTHFRKVLGDLGILDQVAAKVTVVPFGGAIPERVAKGEFAIGVSQATEIVPNKAVRYLGLLPEPHALWTGYSVGSVKGLRMPDSPAAEFAVLIISEIGQTAFVRNGFVL